MEYFKIMQETNNRNVLRPVFPTISQIWGEEKPLLVHGKVENQRKRFVSYPFIKLIFCQGLLIAKKWEKYGKLPTRGRYRPCVLGHVETRKLEPIILCIPGRLMYYIKIRCI